MKAGFVDSVLALAYTDEPVWTIVRGYRHPDGYIIVEPYRRLDCGRQLHLRKEKIHCLGTLYYKLPKHRLVLHDPNEALAILKPRTRQLIEELASKIDAAYYGITGSQAIACASPVSDYDIVIYGVPDDVGERLEKLRVKGLINQCKWDTIITKRRPRHPGDVALDTARIKKSLVDSCYRGLPYTLRILERLNEEACGEPLVPLGVYEGPATIVEAVDPYIVPARYIIELEGLGEAILETWRTRYQELAPARYIIRVSLRLDGGRLTATPDHGGYIAWP